MHVRLTQLDGKLPNLALMKLAAWHRDRGDEIRYVAGARGAQRALDEPVYGRVYGSAIFRFSGPLIDRFRAEWPDTILGGTGTDERTVVEEIVGEEFGERFDYSAAPNDLLDNDFFGQPEPDWRERIAEIQAGGFKVCFSQGLNVRLITPTAAEALASIEYRDDSFARRRLYTAWDNLKDEAIFFRGVDTLERAGIPASHLMAYMLIGFDAAETWERIFRRFTAMVARGIRPYPMVFDSARRDLKRFQRWVVTGLHRAVPFEEYDAGRKTADAPDARQSSFAFDEAVA